MGAAASTAVEKAKAAKAKYIDKEEPEEKQPKGPHQVWRQPKSMKDIRKAKAQATIKAKRDEKAAARLSERKMEEQWRGGGGSGSRRVAPMGSGAGPELGRTRDAGGAEVDGCN
jgi:hypothetical protein